MPYPPEHRVETRKRIVASARKLFVQRGFADVSIDEVMHEAGMTRGGFYHHFDSKDELHAEAVLDALAHPGDAWAKLSFDADPRLLIDGYLSPEHIKGEGGLCPMVALPSDVARASADVRKAYQTLLETMRDGLSRGVEGGKDRALAISALCIGGVVLARSVSDRKLAEAIRRAARDAALELVERGSKARGRTKTEAKGRRCHEHDGNRQQVG